ncbi:MAG: MFS transporter, partial [Pirellulaceae bacterium]
FVVTMGMQMQTVAVGWEVFERTGDELALGWVGLVQFLPVILLTIVAGHVADQFSRRHVMMGAMLLFAAASLGLTAISWWGADYRWMYACLALTGTARAFQQPAKASFLPQLVPRHAFTNAVTWNTGGFHLASVMGPAAGGLLIAWFRHAALVYVLDAASACCFLACLLRIRVRPAPPTPRRVSLEHLVAGMQFVWRSPVILAAITLDMFAVLLGGATTLLPVYAKEILGVGPEGLGWMRTAPALGALAMAIVLAHLPPRRHAGRTLLLAVAGFGVATILFGLSRSFAFSLAMLLLLGALDNISVVIRHTLVQLHTPDELRGRVSAVNSLFIGASNELGGFESGVVARLFTPTISVVSGGLGTLLVVSAVAWRWPQLRWYGGSAPVERPAARPAPTPEEVA